MSGAPIFQGTFAGRPPSFLARCLQRLARPRFAHLQKLKDTANAQLKAGLYVWALGKSARRQGAEDTRSASTFSIVLHLAMGMVAQGESMWPQWNARTAP